MFGVFPSEKKPLDWAELWEMHQNFLIDDPSPHLHLPRQKKKKKKKNLTGRS